MSDRLDRFAGRVLGVATIHGKEQAIAPALCKALPLAGVRAIVGVDTDRFGAFSGEVQRQLDPLATCLAKAQHGAQVGDLDLVIASEGSFGPHPSAPLLSCDEEFLVLYDARDGRHWSQRHVSLDTVFGGQSCSSWEEVCELAARLRFPEHALIVRRHERWAPGDVVHKGVRAVATLRSACDALMVRHGSCWVESDLRAMMNPTRMRVIGAAAARFAEELARLCPVCGAFWFRVATTRIGLPCAECGCPTEMVANLVRGCASCGHEQLAPRPDGRTSADPGNCGECNP